MYAGRLVAAKEHRARQRIHRKEDMGNEQEHNQKSAEERIPQKAAGAARDERIAPQAPRGLEPGMPSSASSDASARTGRVRHAAMAALAVLALAAACACGVFACTVEAQDPMPIEAEQQAGGAAGDNAGADAADADESSTGDSDAGDEGAAASKNAKGKKNSKDKGKAAGKSGKKAADESEAASSSNGSTSGSHASSSGKANGSSSSSSSSKNNGGNGGSTSKGDSNSNASNKITVTMSIDGSRAGDQDSASMSTRKISVKRGANVFDVLVASGVSYSGDSTYVRSISGLAEFQCGGGSGWMYSVDGVFPNVSCGKYQLKGDERIVWAYTLNLGEDVK